MPNQLKKVSLKQNVDRTKKVEKKFLQNFQISPKLNDECCLDSMKSLSKGHLGPFDIGVKRA